MSKRVPRDIVIETIDKDELEKIDDYLKQHHIQTDELIKHRTLSFTAYQKHGGYTIDTKNLSTADSLNMETIVIMPLSDFNQIEDKNYTLSSDDQVYIYIPVKKGMENLNLHL